MKQRDKRVLVIDVGGSKVKLYRPGSRKPIKFKSGSKMTAEEMCECTLKIARRWKYDVVTIGVPTKVLYGRPAVEPGNLGDGWTHYDFRKAFDRPVKILNDATMQALGSYEGGRMLFLGLGTGVGSALIIDDIVLALELGDLRYSDKCTLEDVLSKSALDKLSRKKRNERVAEIALNLKDVFLADYVVLGGGATDCVKKLPKGVRRGANRDARLGGIRVWADIPERPVVKRYTMLVT
jgi:polyphosphate glucokinase